MIDLNQLLSEERRNKRLQERGNHDRERLSLDDTWGQLLYKGTSFSCQVLDISVGGCCVETEGHFRAGAVAAVELEMVVYGMNFRVIGVTHWVDEGNLIGIRFIHAEVKGKDRLAAVIQCLKTNGSEESLRAAIKLGALKPANGQGAEENQPAVPASMSMELAKRFHADHYLARSRKTGEWTITVHTLQGNQKFDGSITELSLGGVNVWLRQPFRAELDQPVELMMEVETRQFRLAGIPRVVQDGDRVGIQFKDMNLRRRNELEEVIREIQAASKEPGESGN